MARVENPPRGDAMDSFLAVRGLYRKPIPKDGSSLFRVFSEQIFNSQVFHATVKEKCVAHMLSHAKLYADGFSTSKEYELYVSRLRSDEEWPGEVEIRALCRIYGVSLVLYREVGREPRQYGDEKDIETELDRPKRVMASMDAVRHFDSVYNDGYLASVAYCQSLVYEMLYKNVFLMEEEIQLGLKNLRSKNKKGCLCLRSTISAPRRLESTSSGDGDVDVESLWTSSSSSESSHKEVPSLINGVRQPSPAASPDASSFLVPLVSSSPSPSSSPAPVCPRHPMGQTLAPMPFPFRVAKALDPDIYRNVEHDTWFEEKKMKEVRATCDLFVKSFMVGDRCLAKLDDAPDTSRLYHAHIQRMESEEGPVTVFVEELGQMHRLQLKNLRVLASNERCLSNRQWKHLKLLQFAPDLNSDPVPLHLPSPRGGYHDSRSFRGFNSHRPVLNACGKPRKELLPPPPGYRLLQPLQFRGLHPHFMPTVNAGSGPIAKGFVNGPKGNRPSTDAVNVTLEKPQSRADTSASSESPVQLTEYENKIAQQAIETVHLSPIRPLRIAAPALSGGDIPANSQSGPEQFLPSVSSFNVPPESPTGLFGAPLCLFPFPPPADYTRISVGQDLPYAQIPSPFSPGFVLPPPHPPPPTFTPHFENPFFPFAFVPNPASPAETLAPPPHPPLQILAHPPFTMLEGNSSALPLKLGFENANYSLSPTCGLPPSPHDSAVQEHKTQNEASVSPSDPNSAAVSADEAVANGESLSPLSNESDPAIIDARPVDDHRSNTPVESQLHGMSALPLLPISTLGVEMGPPVFLTKSQDLNGFVKEPFSEVPWRPSESFQGPMLAPVAPILAAGQYPLQLLPVTGTEICFPNPNVLTHFAYPAYPPVPVSPLSMPLQHNFQF